MNEMDTKVAEQIFGLHVSSEQPPHKYSSEMQWAWKVVEKMKISLLPVEGGQWFAFVGPQESEGWPAPEAMLKVLEAKNFETCGAAVGENVPLIICEAALAAVAKRKSQPNLHIVPSEASPDMH